MISPSHREVTSTVQEFTIPSPANMRDVQDTLIQVSREWSAEFPNEAMSDDTITIQSWDDELKFSYVSKPAHHF